MVFSCSILFDFIVAIFPTGSLMSSPMVFLAISSAIPSAISSVVFPVVFQTIFLEIPSIISFAGFFEDSSMAVLFSDVWNFLKFVLYAGF